MNKDIAKYGRRFTSTNQPSNRGRKPKLYTIAKKTYKISYDEFREMIIHLMQLTKAEIEEVIKDPTTPMWVIDVARTLHKEAGAGRMNALSGILDRLFGKAYQSQAANEVNKDKALAPRSDFLNYSPDSDTLPNIDEDESDDIVTTDDQQQQPDE